MSAQERCSTIRGEKGIKIGANCYCNLITLIEVSES